MRTPDKILASLYCGLSPEHQHRERLVSQRLPLKRLLPVLALGLVRCTAEPTAGSAQPDAVPDACEDGDRLDGEACVPIACGAGTWGRLDTTGPALFVDATAETGGNGSISAPFRAIEDALDAQEDDEQRILVAAGTYVETIDVGPYVPELHLAQSVPAETMNTVPTD